VSSLHSQAKQLLNTFSKYGPTSTPELIQGASIKRDAEELEKFSFMLNENKNIFDGNDLNIIEDLINKIDGLIEEFVNVNDFNDRRNIGNNIIILLKSFTSVSKSLLDNQKEEFTIT